MAHLTSRVAALTLIALACQGAAHAADAVLNIYSARHYQTDEALYKDFTKQTGIQVNRLDGKEDELLERIKNEGANSPADILITVDAARLEIADSLGQRSVLTFNQWQDNAPLKAERFRFQPPVGADVIRP